MKAKQLKKFNNCKENLSNKERTIKNCKSEFQMQVRKVNKRASTSSNLNKNLRNKKTI